MKLILLVFAATEVFVVHSSIHFDEVEFYDPNKTLDESTSNGFVCAHLGEECQISAQCCGVATCALPAWSETPVCLVPGYKHDERFRQRFFSLHNLRPEDIRYIRDSYNTSQYDFLLSDLTFSAPPLNGDADSSSPETMNVNITVNNETVLEFGDRGRNDSIDSYFAGNIIENSTTSNVSILESGVENLTEYFPKDYFKIGYNISTISGSNSDFVEQYDSINNNNSVVNSSELSQVDGFNFKKQFKLLLINNTLEFDNSKPDFKNVYDQIMNTNVFKNVVEQLREKMREINEIEKKRGGNSTENATVSMDKSSETYSTTTELTKDTKQISKWNLVKRFFFSKDESPNNNYNFTFKSHLKETVGKTQSKQVIPVGQENLDGETVLQSNQPKNLNDNEGFEKLIEDVDKIEDILDNDETIKTFHRSNKINDDDLFSFYNIKVPLSSLEDNIKTTGKTNNSLESVFKEIGHTINLMIMKNKDEGEPHHENMGMNQEDQENNERSDVLNETIYVNSNRTPNGIHFWDKIHVWKVPKNITAQVERSFKKWFLWKNKPNTIEIQNKSVIPLNENFLLNLNSKNTQEMASARQTEQAIKPSEFSSYLSSSESESTSVEGLYNNSYVFLVHEEHFHEPDNKLSSWRKVLNLFHGDKVVSLPFDEKSNDTPKSTPCDGTSNPSKLAGGNDLGNVGIPEIIKLPEYLMPEALDKRQGNDTDWIFEDSEDTEYRTIEEHKSNSSFFFFFK